MQPPNSQSSLSDLIKAQPIRKKRSLIPFAMEPVNLGKNLSFSRPPLPLLRKRPLPEQKPPAPDILPVPLKKPRKSIFAPPSPSPQQKLLLQQKQQQQQHSSLVRKNAADEVGGGGGGGGRERVVTRKSTPVRLPSQRLNLRSPRYLLKSPIERFRMMCESPRVRLFTGRARSPFSSSLSPSPKKPRPPLVLLHRKSPVQQKQQQQQQQQQQQSSSSPKKRRSIFAPPLNPVAPKYPYKPIKHTKPAPQVAAAATDSNHVQRSTKYVLKKPRPSIFAPPEVPVPPLYPYHKKLTKPPIFLNKKK